MMERWTITINFKHLRVCKNYNGSVAPAPDKKKNEPTNAELLQQLRQQLKDQHQEMLARLNQAIGLPPPDPTTEDDLLQRVTEKRRRGDKKRKRGENEWEKRIKIAYTLPVFKRALEVLKHGEKCLTDEQRATAQFFTEKINNATSKKQHP